jgi:hypothetical protein
LCNEFLAWYEEQYHVALSSSSLASISLALAEQGDADAKESTISAAAGMRELVEFNFSNLFTIVCSMISNVFLTLSTFKFWFMFW